MSKKLWAGLDVGVETTSLCIIDDAGRVIQQTVCSTSVKSIHREISWLRRRRFARVGLEASSSAALVRGLRNLGYLVDLYETRQLSKFLRVRRNKTDAGDALGIAEAGRVGASLVSKVHLKTLECQILQTRLTVRRHLIRQRISSVNLLCRQIEQYGGRIRRSGGSERLRDRVDAEIHKLFGRRSNSLILELRQLLSHVEQLRGKQLVHDIELTQIAREIEVCRRFMEIRGVGPICALTFYSTVGDPHRFRRSEDVGSYLGLTPRLAQSGLTTRKGRISKMGNKEARSLLVRASVAFMKPSEIESSLRDWAIKVEERRGRGRSRVALARKIAVIMLAMWKSGEHYKLCDKTIT